MILTLTLMTIAIQAQTEVTKFLGIPVDGAKATMIQKLKNKGFDTSHDVLKGKFNGHDSHIFVVTNKDKVCRIMVCDAETFDEGDIRIRFNTLCQQFKNNKKYSVLYAKPISDSEDISYEMLVHSKKYDACFAQLSDKNDENIESFLLNRSVWFRICEYYGKYYISMYYDNEYNRANGEDL